MAARDLRGRGRAGLRAAAAVRPPARGRRADGRARAAAAACGLDAAVAGHERGSCWPWCCGWRASPGLTALERRSPTLGSSRSRSRSRAQLFEIAAAPVIAGGALTCSARAAEVRSCRRSRRRRARHRSPPRPRPRSTARSARPPPCATPRWIARDSVIAAARVRWAPGATRATGCCLPGAPACLGAAGLVLRRGTGERRSEARLWLSTAAAGAVGAAAGYVMLAPSDRLGRLVGPVRPRQPWRASAPRFVYSALAAGAVAVTPRARRGWPSPRCSCCRSWPGASASCATSPTTGGGRPACRSDRWRRSRARSAAPGRARRC